MGNVLVVGGIALIAYAGVVAYWHDPVTDLYTRYQQHRLAGAYEERLLSYRPPPSLARAEAPTAEAKPSAVAAAAQAYRASAREGDPIARLRVPRLGLNLIVVNGTSSGTLKKGPGREPHTFMPGEGKLVYIAGHRTTYLAPFRHIERLKRGDPVYLDMPYGRFEYRVTGSVIVPADDLGRLRSRGRDEVALQACHPRFFATHRWITYARLVRVESRSGSAGAPQATPDSSLVGS